MGEGKAGEESPHADLGNPIKEFFPGRYLSIRRRSR